MRVAFVSTMHSGSWGGSEELWSQAALRLKGDGHEVFVSVISWIRDSEKVCELARHGIQVETHSPDPPNLARRMWQSFKFRGPKYYHRLRQFNPDLTIISQGHNSGGFDWAKIPRQISRPYALIVQCNSDLWWFGELLRDAIESYTAAERVFCVSQRNLELLRLQLGEPLLNAEIIWNPFSVPPENVPVWPKEDGVWRMACPARLYPPAKGQDLLLQALASPEWRDRPVELNLFGSGPDEQAIRKVVKMLHLENVHFRGNVPDIRTIWERNHLLVMPSRFEGVPITLVDAMWCERPAVVTDVGDNAELCIDGKTGFVADSATVSSFSCALQRAWERRMDWQNIGKAARARAEALVPKDAVGLFCEKLKNLAARKNASLVSRQRESSVFDSPAAVELSRSTDEKIRP
jgi:glycosyltransferase involved in cell wall biosynthesis